MPKGVDETYLVTVPKNSLKSTLALLAIVMSIELSDLINWSSVNSHCKVNIKVKLVSFHIYTKQFKPSDQVY